MGEYDEQLVFEMGYDKGFKDGIKGSIPKDQYEARLKADMVAMLTEIQLEIEETEIDNNVPFGFEPVSKTSAFYEGVSASSKVIQQRINAMRKNKT